jgi:hypothetical protein
LRETNHGRNLGRIAAALGRLDLAASASASIETRRALAGEFLKAAMLVGDVGLCKVALGKAVWYPVRSSVRSPEYRD